jgi:hypothetical protein
MDYHFRVDMKVKSYECDPQVIVNNGAEETQHGQ